MDIRIFLFPVFFCLTACMCAQENVSRLKRESLKTIPNENLSDEYPIRKPFIVKEEIPKRNFHNAYV